MVTVTNIKKRVSGDQIKVTADCADVANAETYNVPHLTTIEDGHCDCTTDDTINITFSGNTVTFVNGATLIGRLVVHGR